MSAATVTSPDYPALWRDGTLSGIVVAGTNLGTSGVKVMDHFLRYYRERGFSFPAGPKEVPDLQGFLKSGITSGKVDYLVKEAHSDGDERNVFGLDRKARVMTGERILPDGKREVVDLVFPSPEKTESLLLPNADFGSWIREREKAGGGQFVYFNTSCGSAAKAVNEIQEAQSPLLLDLPTVTPMSVFQNSPTNTEVLLLDGFRNGLDFEALRVAMKGNDEFREGRSNRIVFPDEEEYQAQVTKMVQNPVSTDITVRGPDGKPFVLDSP